MAEYTVKNKKNGQIITFRWNKDTPPTSSDMQRVFDAADSRTIPPDTTDSRTIPPDAGESRPQPIWNRQGGIETENIAPYYKQGIKNLAQRPMETIFPAASSVKGKGVGAGIKRNLMGAADVLSIPDRAIDYASGGAFERGKNTLGEYIDKIPGKGMVGKAVKGNIKTLADIATSPSTYVGAGAIKNALGKETSEKIIEKGGKALAKQSSLDKAIQTGVNKGIKPTVKNKSTFSKMNQFDKNANKAVRTIAENQNKIQLVNDVGEKIPYPKNAADMAQAIEKTKNYIFRQYDDMAKAAGKGGAQFNVDGIQSKLDEIINDVGNPTDMVNYAKGMKKDLERLRGASPEAIQKRIKYYNQSLEGYYAGRGIPQAKAQVDGSVAKVMREELDNEIMSAVGEGYSDLKRQYGSLKAIEKEVNHRAIVNARRANKNVGDLTDIFTGGDLIAGAISGNPALIARGVIGRGIKEAYKVANNPDRAIKNMFKEAYETYSAKPYSMPSDRTSIGSLAGGGIVEGTATLADILRERNR
jgi:hypothetical protein